MFEALALIGDEMLASGRLKEAAGVEGLVDRLMADLAEFPEIWVLNAIAHHRKESPFFPAFSDLYKRIRPREEVARQGRRFEENLTKAREFAALPAPDGPTPEERTATVKKALGYDPMQKARVPGHISKLEGK